MLLCRQRTVIVTASSYLVLLAAGCQLPSSSRYDNRELDSAHHATAELAPPPRDGAAAADETTQAQVMRDVQQISESDPAAGRLLLDELGRAEPKLWPSVVQQFRAKQAYHEQLQAKAKLPAETAANDSPQRGAEPPSAEVGKLTDPRGIRPDPALEQAFAKATPANMPAPIDPAPPGPTQIAAVTPKSKKAIPPIDRQVRLASASSDPTVQQALYTTDSSPPSAPNETPPNRDWQQSLHAAIDDLNERLIDGPRSTAEVHQFVSLRVLELLAGDTENALKPIPNISAEEQDYWSSQLFALATLLDHHRQPDDERRAAASVVHLDEAVGHLREIGSLSLRNLAFCKNVYGYGAYEPINDPTFTPGQRVTLYLEVENYHSESTQKGYTTKLDASYELLDEAGERVAGGDFPKVEDCCQSRRRDFHIQYGLVLPQ